MREVLEVISILLFGLMLGLFVHVALGNPPEVVVADLLAAGMTLVLVVVFIVILLLLYFWWRVVWAPKHLWEAGALVKKVNRGRTLSEEETERFEQLIKRRVVESYGFAQDRTGKRIVLYRITSRELERYD